MVYLFLYTFYFCFFFLLGIKTKKCKNCSYEGEDGTHVEQEGELKRMGDEDMGESVKGAYSYKDDDGKTYSVSYTADENGYRPVCTLQMSNQFSLLLTKKVGTFVVSP